MNRVATVPMHRTLFDSIARSQRALADSQQQLATGSKANSFAQLGTEAVRTLSARSMLARQETQGAVATRLGTTLAIMDTNIGDIEDAAQKLRVRILDTIGTGQSTGLSEAAEEAFGRYRAALNGDEGGVPMFAGSNTAEPPFRPTTLAATAGLDASDAFADDEVRLSARVADGLDLTYGITASELGRDLFAAFRTLAEAGPIGSEPTPAQMSAFEAALGQLDAGLKTVRAVNAENGRRQAQLETLSGRANERALILTSLIGRNEDADMAEVASRITQQRTALEASYSVFARLSELSLVNFLR